ncbi:Lon protease C-terminal proteolytic domain-containing protein [Pisolithus tinctorius]|nr:Lon protease C-terminal proteolytic domain-containing protein [Pisolithus tinctorius]
MAISSTQRLPVLPLPFPVILLPTARLTIPISRELAERLQAVLHDSDSNQPRVIATVPVPPPPDPSNVSSYPPPLNGTGPVHGTAARIVHLVPVRTLSASVSPHQPYVLSLHGLTRIRLAQPLDLDSQVADSLSERTVHHPPADQTPSRGAVETFKDAALRLLDRLAKDSVQSQRKDDWLRVSVMVEDVPDHRSAWMADVLVAAINCAYADKLAFLAATTVEDRLRHATELFVKQTSISEVSQKIANAVDESLSRQQKEYFLRQQLAAIQRELQILHTTNNAGPGVPSGSPGLKIGGPGNEVDDDDQADADDLTDLKKKIEALEAGSEERKLGVREWKRLKRIPQGSVESGVIRTYLEWLTSLPWPSAALSSSVNQEIIKESGFLAKARAQLDADHFGLDQIKRRLIEYLAVLRLRAVTEAASQVSVPQQPTLQLTAASAQPADRNCARKGVKGPILLFVGPPGTGKTSLGQSIAKALGRPFQRISLGGVRDEAEIRGHRRTYVASGPGMIVQALRKAGRIDPVILLQVHYEIDKVGQSNFHGDPAAALLEVLDPEQNHAFNDHYINVPVDLSRVLFICTCNALDLISAPLLDRCEVVELSGYTYDEKINIARRYLLPKQLRANGLSESLLALTDSALLRIVTLYTREAGVRGLERALSTVARFKAVEWVNHLDSIAGTEGSDTMPKGWQSVIKEEDIQRILGVPRWDGEEREREEKIGVVYGLVVTGMGEGGLMPVESTAVPGSGHLKLTGSLGDVIKESGEIALSWVKAHAFDLGITAGKGIDPLKVPDPIDIHLHLPAGAQKKDGPSAGVAMTCALVSLLTGVMAPKDMAMTGEITLRGRVTPVGGIRMKVLGAHRAKVQKIILPWANKREVEHEVALEIRQQMQFHFVQTIDEALEAAFGKGVLGWKREVMVMESRL